MPKAFYYKNENYDESEWDEVDWENAKWGSDIISIILPDSIKRLDGKPFAGCKSLKTIQLPEHLEYLGELMGNSFDFGVTLAAMLMKLLNTLFCLKHWQTEAILWKGSG